MIFHPERSKAQSKDAFDSNMRFVCVPLLALGTPLSARK